MNPIDTKTSPIQPMQTSPLRSPSGLPTPVKARDLDTPFSGDKLETHRSPWSAAFAGAATCATASAAAFHLPMVRGFVSITPAGRLISAGFMGATIGASLHKLFAKNDTDSSRAAVWTSAVGMGAAFAGLAAVAPAFVGMGVVAQLTSWAALSVVAGAINAFSATNPRLTGTALTGAAWASVAAPNLLAPLTPALWGAAAITGAGLGAVHHKFFADKPAEMPVVFATKNDFANAAAA